jgi:hypothetical protein
MVPFRRKEITTKSPTSNRARKEINTTILTFFPPEKVFLTDISL